MTVAEKGSLDVLLFQSKDCELEDLKCFRGDRADVTQEEIESQIHSAVVQLRMHPEIASSDAPALSVKPVDMAVFVERFALQA